MNDGIGPSIGRVNMHELRGDWELLEMDSLDAIPALLSDPERLVWIDTDYAAGETEQLLAWMKERCPDLHGLDPGLAARRERDPTKRPPKAKVFRGFVFARVYWLGVDGPPGKAEQQSLVAQEVHLIAGPSFAVTIRYPCLGWNLDQLIEGKIENPQPSPLGGIDPPHLRDGVKALRDRIDPADPRTVFGLEVAAALVDEVIDSVFSAMDDLRQTANEVERWVLAKDEWLWQRREWPKLDRRVLGLRRVLRQVRWAFLPPDELAEIGSGPFLKVAADDPGMKFKLDDLGREAERANQAVADLIDQVEHTVELRDTIKTDRLNATTYVLTIVATVLLVPTLLAGVYGMNFAHMPKLRWRVGYFVVLGLMAALGPGVWFLIRHLLQRADRLERPDDAARSRSRTPFRRS